MANPGIRVLLAADLPRLVSDMVERALSRADGIELVGQAAGFDTLEEAVRRTHAQVIVLGVSDGSELPEAVASWVRGLPRLVGIAHETGDAHVYVLRPEPQGPSARNVVPDELPGLIRALEELNV